MRQGGTDELDLAIIDALRIAPRATWQELAPVLGIDAATVSRRWGRLERDGLAWVTAHLSGQAIPTCAVVELECMPGAIESVAAELAEDLQAVTIKLTGGARDLMVTVQAPTLQELSGYLLGRLGTVQGVTRVRSHLAIESRIDGSHWRDGALDADQRRRLSKVHTIRADGSRVMRPVDYEIARALSHNGRMSLAELAEQTGLSRSSVRRRLDHLVRAGLLTFRCDTSYRLSDRVVSTVHFGSYAGADLGDLEAQLTARPEVRAVSLVAGPHNVLIDARLRGTRDIQQFEVELRQAVPGLVIADRSVVLRMVKQLGRVLDVDGHAIRTVALVAQT